MGRTKGRANGVGAYSRARTNEGRSPATEKHISDWTVGSVTSRGRQGKRHAESCVLRGRMPTRGSSSTPRT